MFFAANAEHALFKVLSLYIL